MAPAAEVEAAPADTILVTDPEMVRPADGAAGRDARAKEKRNFAAVASAPVEVDTGCGQWRLCDSVAVSLEEVAAALDGVLGQEPVPGRTALNAPMLDSVRNLIYPPSNRQDG